MEPEIAVSVDFSLAEVALKSGLLATEDSVEAERYRAL